MHDPQATLLAASQAGTTKVTYESCFRSWIVWRTWRHQPLLLPAEAPETWEDELCEYFGHGAVTLGYSASYMNTKLYSIRSFHRHRRVTLDIREGAMPFFSLLRKGQ